MERGPICLTLFGFSKWQGNGNSKNATSVPLLTDDSQIGANLRVCADEEDQAHFDQRS
jgi:hypothetical protein